MMHQDKWRKFIVSLVYFISINQLALFAESATSSNEDNRWSPEVIKLAATLPVQDSGRIKPLDTLAQFKLLKMNGRRKCYDIDGRKLTPTEWILDSIFYPEKIKGL